MAGISIALGGIARTMQPDVPKPSRRAQQIKQNVMSNTENLPVIYGRAKVGIKVAFIETSDNNKYLWVVGALCHGEIEAIEEIYFNERLVFDASGTIQNFYKKGTNQYKIVFDASGYDDPQFYYVGETVNFTTPGVTGTLSSYNTSTREWIIESANDLTTIGAEVVWIDGYQGYEDEYETSPGGTTQGPATIDSSNYDVVATKYLGTDTQIADANLITTFPTKWTSEHRGKGVAYIVLKLRHNPNKYSSIPNITCMIKGKKVYNPITALTEWSDNPVLCQRDYLTNTRYGAGIDSNEIDDTFLQVEQNWNDIVVDTPDKQFTFQASGYVNVIDGDIGRVVTGGTSVDTGILRTYNNTTRIWTVSPNEGSNFSVGEAIIITDGTGAGTTIGTSIIYQEKRFACNGIVDTGDTIKSNIEKLLLANRGMLIYQSGKYKIYTKRAEIAVDFELNEDNILGDWQWNTFGIDSTANTLTTSWVNPFKKYQSDTFEWPLPPSSNNTYLDLDNGIPIKKEIDLPYTNSRYTAERITNVLLEESRARLSCQLTAKEEALKLSVGDVVYVTHSTPGWVKLPFWVISISITQANVVSVGLLEYNRLAYDDISQNAFTEGVVTTLADPFNLSTPTGLTINSGTVQLVIGTDGTIVSRMKATWNNVVDNFLTGYELQYRRKQIINTYWIDLPFVDKNGINESYMSPVIDTKVYQVRIRAVNNIGVKSDWSSAVDHTVIGKTALPSEVDSFSVNRYANGERRFIWTMTSPPVDLEGYIIRAREGTNTSWTWDDLLIDSPGNIITNGDFETGSISSWSFYTGGGASASASASTLNAYEGTYSGYINITSGGSSSGNIQFYQSNRTIESGKTYTITFAGMAASNRTITVNVMLDSLPYTNFGFSQAVSLTTSLQLFTYTFTATGGDTNSRIDFYLGGDNNDVYLDVISIQNVDSYLHNGVLTTSPFVVTSQMEARDFRVAIKTIDTSGNESTAGTFLTSSWGTEFPNPFTVVAPTSLQFHSADEHLLLGSDGTITTRLHIMWDIASDEYIEGYELEYKKSTDNDYNLLYLSERTISEYGVGPVEDGQLYQVRIRSINRFSYKSSWLTGTTTPIGKLLPPPEVDSFLVQRLTDGTRRFSWTFTNKPLDHAGYIIKYKSGTSYTDWSSLTNNLYEGLLTSSPYETNDLAAGDYAIGIKAVDTSGIESPNGIFITSTLGDPRLSGQLYTEEAKADSWATGLKSRKLTFQSVGYISAIAGDIGKTVVGGTTTDTGILIAYDNTTREWVVAPVSATDLFDNASEAIIITDGTGAGTTNSVSIINCWVDTDTYLAAKSKATWATLPSTWATWTDWGNGNYESPITYETAEIDVTGGAFDTVFNILVVTDGDGTITLEQQNKPDGGSYTAWTTVNSSTSITARYVKIRVKTDNTSSSLTLLRRFEVILAGTVIEEYIEDLDTSTLTGAYDLGVGNIRLPITKTYIKIRVVNIALQNVGAGWTWELIDKDTTTGPNIKIYNSSSALADANIDVSVIGL